MDCKRCTFYQECQIGPGVAETWQALDEHGAVQREWGYMPSSEDVEDLPVHWRIGMVDCFSPVEDYNVAGEDSAPWLTQSDIDFDYTQI